MNHDAYGLLATNEELDRIPFGRELADWWQQVDEFGNFDEQGGELSLSDFEGAIGG